MQTILVNGQVRQTGHAPEGFPHVSVNGVTIPEASILREAQNHPAASPGEALAAAARALVVRELLLQEARSQIRCPRTAQPDRDVGETGDEALIGRLLEGVMSVPEADEASCRRFFLQNRDKFRGPDVFEAEHILFPAARDDTAARRAARGAAAEVISQLEARPQDFGGLARVHSSCPSASSGGRLGRISRGQTCPEFERALSRLVVGKVAPDPVETRYGVHVIRVSSRQEGSPLAFEQVNDQIAEHLKEVSWRNAVRSYVGQLAGQSVISGLSLDAS